MNAHPPTAMHIGTACHCQLRNVSNSPASLCYRGMSSDSLQNIHMTVADEDKAKMACSMPRTPVKRGPVGPPWLCGSPRGLLLLLSMRVAVPTFTVADALKEEARMVTSTGI